VSKRDLHAFFNLAGGSDIFTDDGAVGADAGW
jgi:hypothetical protein